MDIYFQQFKGFYVSSPFTELNLNKPSRYPQLPEAGVINWGLNWYHTLDSTYSLKAAFNQTEFQLKSGGSWLYTPFYNHLEMDLGGVLTPGSDPGGVSVLPNLASGRFDTVGWGLGYGYMFIRNRFFTGSQLALSPGLQYQRIRRSEGGEITKLSLAGKGNLNFSLGWNFDEYVGGVKILVDSLYARVSGTELWSSLVAGQVFVGARF
jgi:hypothetical protein